MIEFDYYEDIPTYFTGVCKTIKTGNIFHMKDGKFHNEHGPVIIWSKGNYNWSYKGKCYYNEPKFTNESWKEFVEELKRKEELKIFI